MNPLRKYWGPYCPVPQDHSEYVHVIHPTSSGCTMDNGLMRELTPQELDELDERGAFGS